MYNILQGVEDKITEERHEMETEGGLQTVCIREEREYLSLSSWMREGKDADGEERRWRVKKWREMSKFNKTDGWRR